MTHLVYLIDLMSCCPVVTRDTTDPKDRGYARWRTMDNLVWNKLESAGHSPRRDNVLLANAECRNPPPGGLHT